MKRIIAAFALVLIVLVAVVVFMKARDTKKEKQLRSRLIGAWVLISDKADGRDRQTPWGLATYKQITPGGFIWLSYDKITGRISRAAGGTYTLRGNIYAEKIEYGIGRKNEIIRYSQASFTATVDGDIWYHKGSLTNGQTIEQIWKRIKPVVVTPSLAHSVDPAAWGAAPFKQNEAIEQIWERVKALVVTLGFTPSADPAAGPALNGQNQVTTALQQLKPGTKTQWEAIYTIANSLDPRIPAACLPMLQSSYPAVQRNAARAIGSRWWQIPQNQLSTYVQALKMNLRSKDEQLVNMTRRGIGLLTCTYDSDMFSRSTSGRWVIYERHGKPCIIDTRNHTEELLGAGLEGTFSPSYSNEPLTGSCLWHPKEDIVALRILTFHGPSPLWVWRSAGGVRSFGFPELMIVLKHANIEVSERSPYYYAHFKEWKGADLDFTVEYIFGEGERGIYHTALLRWESATDTVRLIADTLP